MTRIYSITSPKEMYDEMVEYLTTPLVFSDGEKITRSLILCQEHQTDILYLRLFQLTLLGEELEDYSVRCV